MNRFFVYVLRSLWDSQWYIGYTHRSVEKRLEEHNAGRVISTKHRCPLELIYYEMYRNQADALGREKFLKSGSGHCYLKKQLKHFLNVAP